MQNKKTLLQRLLVIYITFFIVLVVSIAHSFLPNFTKGYSEGSALSNNILKSWAQGTPRMIYLLGDVSLKERITIPIEGLSTSQNLTLDVYAEEISLNIEQDAASDSSVMSLAFRSIGGSVWLYALVMLGALAYLAIIVLMFVIIHSLRRSIREESSLDKHNIWLLRTIGLLTIFSELSRNITSWEMSRKAAELLVNTNLAVDTTFHISYGAIIMGILILFAAEVFAIGQNLSEEQKLTI